MRLPFVKMSGAGNDFVMIDHDLVGGLEDGILSRLAADVCRRRHGVGADGLVTVRSLGGDRARMVYLNADGSRAGMCGNAGRCASRYAFRKGWVGESLILEADDGAHRAEILADGVCLGMRDPQVCEGKIELSHEGRVFVGISLDTGVPHLVLWVDDVDRVDVEAVGRVFRFDPRFQPEGTNVNFAEVLGPSVLRLRTYERGVERETLACGTGAVAAAVGACLQKGAGSPVELRAPGGTLRVKYRVDGEGVRGVTLEGDAKVVYEGVLEYQTRTATGAGKQLT
ncbi:MAG: diaminopimelate epimerase [Candidatus Eisenbacteria sp.]|nr:diaminopimelate epimerase [Candidatus Eisenbacteria bacterium]